MSLYTPAPQAYATRPLFLDNLHFEHFVKYFNLDLLDTLLTKCPHGLRNIYHHFDAILIFSRKLGKVGWTTIVANKKVALSALGRNGYEKGR